MRLQVKFLRVQDVWGDRPIDIGLYMDELPVTQDPNFNGLRCKDLTNPGTALVPSMSLEQFQKMFEAVPGMQTEKQNFNISWFRFFL